MACSGPSISQIHPLSQIQAWRGFPGAPVPVDTGEAGHGLLQANRSSRSLWCSVASPHTLGCAMWPKRAVPPPPGHPMHCHLTPTAFQGRGDQLKSSTRPLECPQHLRPTPAPTRSQPIGPSKHQVDLGEGFLTLTMFAAPARIFPLVESGFRTSSLALCRFPEEKTKALSGAVICPGYSGQVSPGGARGKEPACQCRRCKRHRFDPWVGTIPWRRAWQLMPVFLPGESPRQRSLAGYSP